MGPASPDEPPPIQTQSFSTMAAGSYTNPAEETFAVAAGEARAYALSQGHDPDSFFEQKVVWGDLDSFRCVMVVFVWSHSPLMWVKGM